MFPVFLFVRGFDSENVRKTGRHGKITNKEIKKLNKEIYKEIKN